MARDKGGCPDEETVTCFSVDLVGRLFDLLRTEMLTAGFF